MFLIPGRFADGIPVAARIPALDQARRRPLYLRSGSVRKTRRACREAGAQARSVHRARLSATTRSRRRTKPKPPEEGESAAWIARPALCIEPRDGKLFVFMPPVEYLADYLDLVAAIEDTAAHLKMPVLIEGYAPPYDPRIAVVAK